MIVDVPGVQLVFFCCSQQRVEQGLLSIERAREGFRSIALRGAIIFNVNQYMTEVNPLYVCSMQQFLDVYDAAILHSERSVVNIIICLLVENSD